MVVFPEELSKIVFGGKSCLTDEEYIRLFGVYGEGFFGEVKKFTEVNGFAPLPGHERVTLPDTYDMCSDKLKIVIMTHIINVCRQTKELATQTKRRKKYKWEV